MKLVEITSVDSRMHKESKGILQKIMESMPVEREFVEYQEDQLNFSTPEWIRTTMSSENAEVMSSFPSLEMKTEFTPMTKSIQVFLKTETTSLIKSGKLTTGRSWSSRQRVQAGLS